MESRKLQKTGGSTLIVSLPKKWTKEHKLDSGSEVRLLQQPNGTMTIDPGQPDPNKMVSVSYTHLTLPTILLV